MADDADLPGTTAATEDEGGTEVVGGRAAVEPARGLPTETRVFGVIGAAYVVGAVVYWTTSHEPAGTAMLTCAALFALVTAAYFGWRVRPAQLGAEADEWPDPTEPPSHAGMYLPHTSVWAIGIALGAALTLAGIPIGWWVCLPGVALLVHSVIGFAAQSRQRA